MKVLMSQFFFFRNGTETVSIMFSKPEKRANWEESFNEAKQKLGKPQSIISVIQQYYQMYPYRLFTKNPNSTQCMHTTLKL